VRRRGATAAELAIAAPLLFLLVFGMIEIGRLVMVRQALSNSARIGCREAALASTRNSDDVEAVVRAQMASVVPDAFNVDKVTVSSNPADLAAIQPGNPVTVVVGVDFSEVSWLPHSLVDSGGTLVLTGSSTQRRE
jgi:Flp pilus assembly protein TadG